jgi:hypothetical protein
MTQATLVRLNVRGGWLFASHRNGIVRFHRPRPPHLGFRNCLDTVQTQPSQLAGPNWHKVFKTGRISWSKPLR